MISKGHNNANSSLRDRSPFSLLFPPSLLPSQTALHRTGADFRSSFPLPRPCHEVASPPPLARDSLHSLQIPHQASFRARKHQQHFSICSPVAPPPPYLPSTLTDEEQEASQVELFRLKNHLPWLRHQSKLARLSIISLGVLCASYHACALFFSCPLRFSSAF